MMETDGDTTGRAVLDFLLFLNDGFSQTSRNFEDNTACSPESANILRILVQQGTLKVKDIVQRLPGMDPSKLSRLIDALEGQAYITRTINPEDRRSFLIAPTAQGLELLERFSEELAEVAQAMLAPLTTTERLILVELFAKIQRDWTSRLEKNI